jgi:LuxR family transcriptional regulator, maltose regulon positive regulatory protein
MSRCQDSGAVGLKVRPESTDGPVTPTVNRGIVSRRELFDRIADAGRVVHLCAPAGSGKTILLRSWISDAGLAESAAWVVVGADLRDPQRFWVAVADGLRATAAGSKLVKALTAAPDLDGWAIVERLLADLGPLDERIWLVLDDLQELRSDEGLRQLELFLMRAPSTLRFALATRHDLRLGLHRLRLEGELTDIRAADLRFTPAGSRALFEAAGVNVADSALEMLLERTEGWAAGLRLAALSLRGHADPNQFAAEFSGTDRTVAEYLLAEVLERQTEEVRRLLLRTSILERVNGPLADILTGSPGGERVLQELEEANAFVIAVDSRRSWFRYHRLFADLLQLELRRSEPAQLLSLHGVASDWYAEHGYPIEAITHAQAAERWNIASGLLFDRWLSLQLDGQGATAHELLSRFPAEAISADPELAALKASDELTRDSVEKGEAHLVSATRGLASLPEERRGRFEVALALLRLTLARRRGDLPAVIDEAERLLATAGGLDAPDLALDDLRAVALISVGIAELWSNRTTEADRHFEQGVALARQLQRPWLEINALGHWAMLVRLRSFPLAIERSTRAIELAERHGWSDTPIVLIAYVTLGNTLVWQGRFEEGERWIERAERMGGTGFSEPTNAMMLHVARGMLEGARGSNDEALAAFRAAERYAQSVVTPHTLATQARALVLLTLLRMGRTQPVEQALATMDEEERRVGDMCTVLSALRLAQGDPHAATAALAPVIDGSAPLTNPGWLMRALVLDAIARDALGDVDGADRALTRALDLAEPNGAVVQFLLVNPEPRLLERHARHRTAHAALVSEILNLLAGKRPAPTRDEERLREPLSESETRILRYLPTNLSVPEIADQTYLSANTVKTHMRHLYGKLGAHSRGKAVERARALGLLAPSALRSPGRS